MDIETTVGIIESKNRKQLKTGFRKLKDSVMKYIIYAIAAFNIIIVFLIFLFILKNSLKFFDEYSIVKFFSGKDWVSLSEIYGLLPLAVGSAWVTFIALLIAVPISIVTAVYISKFAKKNMRETLKIIIETMAAIPSVVLGYIGLAIVAEVIKKIFNLDTGFNTFTGGVILAFMALPTMISISDDAIRALDESYEKASLALGANRIQTIVKVILPAAFPGIFAGIMLGFGRIIGETMTVLMLTGNSANMAKTPFMPARTMTATIAAEMGEVVNGSTHYYSLFAIGLVLFGITFITNTLADFFINRARKKMKG